jgi:aminoglycoside phosphotransferase (APT) family kinase protein
MMGIVDVEILERGLGGRFRVLARAPSERASTYPAELVHCRRDDGSDIVLLWKRAGGREHSSGGHRRDVAYEAAVYRHVLRHTKSGVPVLYAVEESGSTAWIAIEFLDGAKTVEAAPDPIGGLEAAARWAADFHAGNEARLSDPALRFLTRYDGAYYDGWARRTVELAGFWHGRLPWLRELAGGLGPAFEELTAVPPTVIHGEYTPHNVLVRDRLVYPVDWESAAIAPGEIDLVSLTDKWPPQVAQRCVHAYADARQRDYPEPGFGRRLDLARLYWDLRWLGDRPEWTRSEKVGPRFQHLRGTAERLGLL